MTDAVSFRKVASFLAGQGWRLHAVRGPGRIFIAEGSFPPLMVTVYVRDGLVAASDWRAIQSFVADAQPARSNGRAAPARLRRKAS